MAAYRRPPVTLIFVVFLLCTLLQLIWLLGIFSRLAFSRGQYRQSTGVSKPANDHKGVSVIICAHNELANLKNLIPALINQDYPMYEIILVDDRSTDGTAEWLQIQQIREANLKLVTVTSCPQGQNPKKHALLQGINAASHDVLLLTDADCLPKSNAWITLMAGQYKDQTKFVLGYSGYQKTSGLLNKQIRYETLMTAMQYLSRALNKKPYMGVGRNLSYRKSYFQQVDGLWQIMHLTGGDDDLFVNKFATGENTEVCLEKDAVMVSKPKSTWTGYFKQKLRHLFAGKYYKTSDKWILGIFSVTHIIFWSSLVSLLITSTMVYWVAAGFIIRQLALTSVVGKSSQKLGEPIGILCLPLLDFLYSFFYLYTGLAALSSKKVKWH